MRIANTYRRHIGFPTSVDFDLRELYPLFAVALNNVGDPYEEGLNANHTKEIEREVIDFFADLFRAPLDDRWGYVTNGGTEANLYALYLARELYPDGRLYFSDAAHYSMPKNAHLLSLPGGVVRTHRSGEMDYDELRRQVAEHPGRPAIVVANIGTTMTEAHDNVTEIQQALRGAGAAATFIHADAALAGIYTAFSDPHWPFDFADGIDSISVTGHKFVGSPMPCGVVIVRDSLRIRVMQRAANYTGSADYTISGSRNGHTPIVLWYAIQRWGTDGFRRRAMESLVMAESAHQQLLDIGWPTWRNPGAITVMLAEPDKDIVRKWQLATEGGWSHVVCMPGTPKDRIDEFINDLAQARHY